MPKPQPKENFQLRRIFGLAKPLNCDEEALRDLAGDVTNGRTSSLAELTFDEANAMIVRLGGEAMTKKARRTINYQRQQAGVKQIETAAHKDFMHELARLRGMTEEGLEKLGTRMLGHWPPRTTAEGNKVIEALKAMNKRDGLTPPTPTKPTGPGAAAEPRFRKVA